MIEEKKNKYSKENLKKFLSNALWTYKELFKMAPRDTFLILFFTLLMATFPNISAWINARIIDEILKLIQNRTALSDLNFQSPALIFILASALIGNLKYLITNYKWLIDSRFRLLHLNMYTTYLYKKISSLDVAHFEDKDISNSIKKAEDNLWKVRDFLDTSVVLLTELFSVIITFSILSKVSLFLILFLIIITIPGSVFFAKYIVNWWKYYDKNTEKFRSRWWSFDTISSEEKIKENKVSNSNRFIHNFLDKLDRNLFTNELKIRIRLFKQKQLTVILSFIQDIILTLYFLSRLLKGDFTFGDYSFYIGRSYDFSTKLDSLLGRFIDIFDSSLGIDSVRKVFGLKNSIVSGNKKIDTRKPPQIEFKNVSFKYPKSNKYVLKNINLTINPKDEIAIVGENGAGKTSLIKLLLRFYDVTSGEILINGNNIKDLDLNTYYSAIGSLFQEYNIYGFLSIETNIKIGSTDKGLQKLQKATKEADAYKFIMDLDDKYKHKMSKQFDNGVNLSTGQQQKIALARMFYRGAPILILDEPTASIDAIAEHKIFNRIYKFMKDKTVIIISHRFSTVRNAQKIYVIDKGRIIEQGTHNALIKEKGKYNKAFSLQAEGYQN